jgi:hypothetical protein
MTFPTDLLDMFEDTITIEPFSAETGARVQSWGAAVTYNALIQRGARRTIGRDGREVVSNVQVIIPERVTVDPRSKVTLPSGFAPQTPPILGVEPLKGLNLDHTVILL